MKNKRDQDRLGWLMIAGLTVTLLVGVSFYWFFFSKKSLLDEHTMCPIKGEVQRDAILIDKSDKWATGDVSRVSGIVLDAYRNVPMGGRLSVYTITGVGRKTTEVAVVFDMCNPGSEAECNSMFANCKKIQRSFKQAFDTPFRRLTEQLAMPGESSYSPILETIGTMVKDSKAGTLRLHLVSDFVENHKPFRFYDVIPLDTEMVAEYPLPKKASVTVNAYFIQHRSDTKKFQDAVAQAWSGYFEKQGIKAVFTAAFTAE